jgi:hypothetical protein
VSQLRRRGSGPLQNAVKGIVYAYTPPRFLTHRALYSMGYDNRIQNGTHDCRGPAKAQGTKGKPNSRVSAAQSK